MALNAYLKMKGQKQGDIKGSVTQKGREGKIMVIAVSHEIVSPRDAASGQATGRRQHKPFVITKEIDKSSPLLYNALVTNENINSWELMFYAPQVRVGEGAGAEVNHYTVKLTNARIVDVKSVMLNNKNPELVKFAEYEEVAFVYQKIEWTWVDGGITSSDDWDSPIV
ncbi:MAG: Hcp family type VI secretion system effector [Chitinophagaceae bacterium]